MLHKWEYILPAVAFLAAFTLRYHFLATYRYPLMIHEQDAVGYMDAAKSILHLRFPTVSGRPPGYPIVIALFAMLPVGLEYAARLASIFMDALIVLPLFYISRIYLPRVDSFMVCLMWVFFTFSLVFSTSPLSQSSYLCYLLVGIALLHRGLEKKRVGWLLCAGVFFALSYLARPEGIVGFVCGFLLCLIHCFKRGCRDKKNLLIPVCLLSGFLLVAGPYLAAMHSAFGSWTLSPLSEAHVKTADVILTLNAKGELRKTGSTGLSVWREQYKTFPLLLEAVWANIRAFAVVYRSTFPLWMHLASGAGLLFLFWKSPRRNSALLLIPLAVIVPNFLVSIPKTHSYLYPLFALTFICFVACVGAIDAISKKLVPGEKPRLLAASLTVAMVLVISPIAFESCLIADEIYQSPEQVMEAMVTECIYKGAGEIIKSNSQEHDVIMTRWGLVGYFADRPVLTLPKGGTKEVVEYGRKNGARFIVIDTNSVLSRRQELRELLGPLEGRPVNPAYGIEIFKGASFPDLGGYVIYRYQH